MTLLNELHSLNEKKWSGAVDTEWKPEEGFFTKSADDIAAGLKAKSKDLKQAMSRLNFYINRAGKNLSADDKARLESAKDKLRKKFGVTEDLQLNEEPNTAQKVAMLLPPGLKGENDARPLVHDILINKMKMSKKAADWYVSYDEDFIPDVFMAYKKVQQGHKFEGVVREGVMDLSVMGSDGASDLAYDVVNAAAKVLRAGLKDKGNQYNTPGPVNVAMIITEYLSDFPYSDQLHSVAKETLRLLKAGGHNGWDQQKGYAKLLKKLEDFVEMGA